MAVSSRCVSEHERVGEVVEGRWYLARNPALLL